MIDEISIIEGIHNISEEAYHADPCVEISLSRSIINTLLTKAPIKAFLKHPRLNPDFQKDEGDKKFDVGKAAHPLLLEGTDNACVIDADSWRTKAVKDERDEARERGEVPLLTKEYDKVMVMVKSAEKQIQECSELEITNLQADGNSEQTLIWSETDEIGRKSWHRIRPDWRSHDNEIMLDYKTTGTSADPNEYLTHIFKMGYDIQESYYRRGAMALTGINPKFILVVQETEEPYLCSFIGLNPMYQDMGKQKVDMGIFLWNQHMQSGMWPGYPNRVCHVEPPPWALAQWEAKALNLGV